MITESKLWKKKVNKYCTYTSEAWRQGYKIKIYRLI